MKRALSRSLPVVCLAASIACSQGGESVQLEDPPRELYLSKAAHEYVEFSGVQAELREALLERDMLLRTESVARILQQLGPDSAQDVFEVFETAWLDQGSTELFLLAEWWARFDPHGALEWAEGEARTAQTYVPYQVMRSWATHDPQAAFARSLETSYLKPLRQHEYRDAVIGGWEESGRQEVFEFIRDLGPGEQRQRAIRGFARRMVLREGLETSFAWADSLPEEDRLFKLNVIRRIASHAAKEDPVQTAAWVKKYENTYHFRSLPQRVSIQWAHNDPVATMKWLAGLPEGRDTDLGVREAFRVWTRLDYDGAVAWLESEPHARYKDEAVALVARHLQIGEPERAIEMSREIVNEDTRIGTLVTIARSWGVQDKVAAEEWVNGTSTLTPKQKKLALTYGERWRRSILIAAEKRARTDEQAAQERLDDMSDPAFADDFTVRELLGTWDEPASPENQQLRLRELRKARAAAAGAGTATATDAEASEGDG